MSDDYQVGRLVEWVSIVEEVMRGRISNRDGDLITVTYGIESDTFKWNVATGDRSKLRVIEQRSGQDRREADSDRRRGEGT